MKQKILAAFALAMLLVSGAQAQFGYDFGFGLGLNADDQGYSITADDSGNIIATGYHTYWMNANPLGTQYILNPVGSNSQNVYVAKYNPQGIMAWAFDLGSYTGSIAALKVAHDPTGNIYIAGWYNDTVNFSPRSGNNSHICMGATNGFLAKYDRNGNFLWANVMNGDGTDEVYDIAYDAVTGHVLVTGSFSSGTLDMDSGTGVHLLVNQADTLLGGSNCFIAAYSAANGSYAWAYGIGNYSGTAGTTIAVDDSANIYVGGNVNADSTNMNPAGAPYWVYADINGAKFLAKYTSSGNVVWATALNGEGGITADGLEPDNNGGVYQTGYFNASLAPGDSINFNPGGTARWLQTTGTQAGYVAKYNSSTGAFEWAFSLLSNGSNVAQDFALDNQGHFFITGAFGDTVDFDPGTSVHNLYGYPNGSIFLAEYDTAGNYIQAMGIIDSVGAQFGVGICTIGNNRVGITGFFSADTLNFGVPGEAVHNLEVYGGDPNFTDAFMAVYFTNGDTSTGIHSLATNQQIKIYPNPTTGVVNLFYQGAAAVEQVEVLDLLGHAVYQSDEKWPSGSMRTVVNCSSLAAGVYFMRVKTSGGFETERFVKQ